MREFVGPQTVTDAERCDPVTAALRLGSAAIGRTLSYREQDGAGSSPSPVRAVAVADVRGDGAAALGRVDALDLTGEALGPDELRSLADVATLIGGHVAGEARIGYVDHVTRLPNRRGFERDFTSMVRAAASPCLVLATVAEAKHFNDILRALGHACAETFLREAAAAVGGVAPAGRAIYHVSVLSFAFILDAALEPPVEAARALGARFQNPLLCAGLPIATRLGIGIAPIEEETQPAERLRAALVAAQDSRRSDSGFALYDRTSDEAHLRSFRLLTDFDAALNNPGELSLVYQPRIDLASGRTAGAEALIRWTHPTLGPISPAEFVPLVETTGLIEPLTDFVLERSTRVAADWRRRGLDAALSINVSPSTLHRADLASRVRAALGDADLEPSRIELEFTEGVLTASEASVRSTMEQLRALGVSIAIDDFGSGYSNLGYLTRIPADVLKIDRSMTRDVETDDQQGLLVRTIVDLAHNLGLRIVAEGVETAEAYDTLWRWGCDEAQGYYMSRPIPPDDFLAFAASYRA